MTDSVHIERNDNDRFSEQLAQLVQQSNYDQIDSEARQMLRYFLADTLAVGAAGMCNPGTPAVYDSFCRSGSNESYMIPGREALSVSADAAAVLTGFQMHCLEWDGLHEPSVVIALCGTCAALSIEAQRRELTVADFLLGMAVGVEVAAFFGLGSASGPRFFRPSVAGLMGASMALAKVRGYDLPQIRDTLGLAYSQASGTMQAHWEGSEALALQVGIAARAAHNAADLAQAGFGGPHHVVTGKFGYFRLFETEGDLQTPLNKWGAPWKITEVAHKPFPAGRATQATLTAIYELRKEIDFSADDIAAIDVEVPPLIALLVGRPYKQDMSPSYARLCLQYVIPRMLLDRKVDPVKFAPGYYDEQEIQRLAPLVKATLDGNEDQNALGPQKILISLKDGRQLSADIADPMGSPTNRLNRQQRVEKIAQCFKAAGLDNDADAYLSLCEDIPDDAMADKLIEQLVKE